MDVSVITSLYQAEAHLDAYCEHVLSVADQVAHAGLALELVIVANEASETERAQIDRLSIQAESAGSLRVTQLHVPRETLYASWNRGIGVSTGGCVAFWNVDDARYASGLIEAARRIADGCDLVEFPVEMVRSTRLGRVTVLRRRELRPPQYQPDVLTLKSRLGPFFAASRTLFERAGSFDEHFKIAGDFEWCARPAVRAARVCYGMGPGGIFHLHGGNLSGTHNPLEVVEDAIVALRYGLWDQVHPTDPDLLRDCWLAWGAGERTLSQEWQDRVWGEGAQERWQQWQADHARQQRGRRLRTLPRWVIDHTHTRDWLARLGLVHPSARRKP